MVDRAKEKLTLTDHHDDDSQSLLQDLLRNCTELDNARAQFKATQKKLDSQISQLTAF